MARSVGKRIFSFVRAVSVSWGLKIHLSAGGEKAPGKQACKPVTTAKQMLCTTLRRKWWQLTGGGAIGHDAPFENSICFACGPSISGHVCKKVLHFQKMLEPSRQPHLCPWCSSGQVPGLRSKKAGLQQQAKGSKSLLLQFQKIVSYSI